MRNFARFLGFLSGCFIVMFIVSIGITLLRSWINAAIHVPIINSISLQEVIEAARWTLPFTLYLAIIFSIDYGKRQKIASPLIFLFVMVFANAFTFGVSRTFENLYNMPAPPLQVNHSTLGRHGLILSQHGVIITMLDQPSNENGSRVVSIKDQPFIYQKVPAGAGGTPISLPPIPFRGGGAWLPNSVLSDLSISGRYIAERFDEGGMSFLAWSTALILFLISLAFIVGLSRWPLANVFLGILAFRGILAFEIFLNSEEIMEYLTGFARGALPDMFITPAILTTGAVLILIYSFLHFLARVSNKNAV